MPDRAATGSPSSGGKTDKTQAGYKKPSAQNEMKPLNASTRAKPTKPTKDLGETFQRDIYIFDGSEYQGPYVASLDTLCQAGICISSQLVESIGKANDISPVAQVHLRDANDNKLEVRGSISLRWKWHGGTRAHVDTFQVLRPEQFDVIIGVESIVAMDLLTLNKKNMMPMIAHEIETLSEKAMIALQEEQQRQEKAAIEQRRLDSEEEQQQKNGESRRG